MSEGYFEAIDRQAKEQDAERQASGHYWESKSPETLEEYYRALEQQKELLELSRRTNGGPIGMIEDQIYAYEKKIAELEEKPEEK